MDAMEERQQLRAEAEERERRAREERERLREEAAIRHDLAEDTSKPWNMYDNDPRVNAIAGVARGVSGAVEETFDLAASVDEWLGKNVGKIDFNPFDGDGIGLDEFEEGVDQSPFRAPESGWREIKSLLPESETTSAQLAETTSKFVAGFAGAGKIKWLSQLRNSGRAGFWTASMTQGALADLAVWDGHERRASDFLIQFDNPIFNNTVTQYLAVGGEGNEDVGELEGRMKNILEGAGLGVITDGVILSFRALKNSRAARGAVERMVDRHKSRADLNARVQDIEDAAARAADEPADAADFGFRPEVEDAADELPVNGRLNSQSTPADISARLRTVIDEVDPEDLQRAVDEGDLTPFVKGDLIDFDSFADDPASLIRFMAKLESAFADVFRTVPNRETIENGLKALEDQIGAELAVNLFRSVKNDQALSARVFASQQAMTESWAKLKRLSDQVASPRASDTHRLALLQQIQAHAALDAHLRGAEGEVGRALQIMRQTKQAREQGRAGFDELMRSMRNGDTVDEMARKLKQAGNDMAAGAEIVRRSFGRKVWSVLHEVFYGNVLSAPSTQVANILGNAYKTAETMLVRTLAYGYHSLGAMMPGRSIDAAAAAQFKGAWVGMVQGFQNTFRFNVRALLGEMDTKGFSVSKMSKDERIEFYSELESIGTVWRAILSGRSQTDAVTKIAEAGASRRAIEWTLPADLKDRSVAQQLAQRGMKSLVDPIGGAVRLPGRVIVSIDEVFKTIAHDTERTALAYTDAASIVKSDPELDLHKVAAELISDERYNEAALQFAREQTFQQELGRIGRSMENLAHAHPSFKFVLPFVRTPTNLVKDAYSKVEIFNVLSRQAREDIAAGGRALETRLAKMTVSAGLGWFLFEQYTAGNIVGGGSGKNSERLDGVQPYSIKLGDTWHTYNRLDPLGMIVGVAADAFELSEQINDPDAQFELEAAFGGFLAAVSSNITGKTYLRGVSDLMGAFSNAERGSSGALAKWSGSMLANLIPLAGSNFERRRAADQDEFARYVFTWMDEFRSRIPEGGVSDALGLDTLVGGNRQDLGVRRDPLGRALEEKYGLSNVIIESDESTSRLDRALANLEFNISMPARRIEGIPLDTKQYSKYLYLRGQEVRVLGLTLEEALERELDDPLFNARTDVGQQDRVNRIVRDYGETARDRLLAEDDELRERVEAAKATRLRDKKGIDFEGLQPTDAEPQPTEFEKLIQSAGIQPE